uniref:C-type lectin domain-containing protein n=1 Tax=Plectus sambesii TaxID=2011161 RepID=A0A914W197_9BILA
MLEHKCKQFPKWFWWEKSKSCILLDILNRRPAYAKLVCTHIPGYRGHLAHVNKVEKLASLDSFRDQVKNTEAWIGLERDANITTDTQDGFFWRRDDGYKVLLNQKEFPLAQRKYDNKNALFATLNTWYLQDDLYNTEFIAMCEYEEDLRYEPTMLDVNCASLSQTHIYYKGSCYVRDETKVTYDVAKKSCNHIDGFNGHLAVLNTEELLTIIYYAITKPLVANDYYWIGLERLDTSSANVSNGWYWLTGSGVNYPVTDFSAFKSGWPKADPCGYGWISNLASDLCTNTYAFLCEYVEPNKGTHFRIQANFANQKTAPQMILKGASWASLVSGVAVNWKAIVPMAVTTRRSTMGCRLPSGVKTGKNLMDHTNLMNDAHATASGAADAPVLTDTRCQDKTGDSAYSRQKKQPWIEKRGRQSSRKSMVHQHRQWPTGSAGDHVQMHISGFIDR